MNISQKFMFDVILNKFCKFTKFLFTYKFLKVNRKLRDTCYMKISLEKKSSNLSKKF